MTIKIYDNQRVGIADALQDYLTTTEGFQDYAMGAGCAGDVMYSMGIEGTMAKNLIVAGGSVGYLSKVPNAIFSYLEAPDAIMGAIREPTFVNVGRAFYSITNVGATSIQVVQSGIYSLLGKVASVLSLCSSAMEVTLDTTSLIDQFSIEEAYSKKNMGKKVFAALKETRIWRGLCLGKSLAKTCAKVSLVAAPFLALPIAIGVVATATAVSIGMSVTETIFKKCIMDHVPVHPTHLKNQGKDLALIRDKTCIIL